MKGDTNIFQIYTDASLSYKKIAPKKYLNGIYYNSMADYLSRYWLDKDIAMNRIKKTARIFKN